jgi:adenylate cyclase class 2
MMKQNAEFEEIECKFLNVDIPSIEAKLQEFSATLQFKELFRRTVFDYPDLRLDKDNSWLRVRDEGHRVTASFKKRIGVNDGQNDSTMHEVEIVIDSFDQACELFTSIGMKAKFYEENRRTQYILDGVEICIDEWPLLPPYIELEGSSWGEVEEMAKKLGFDWADRKVYSTAQVYKDAGITESDYQILTFDKQIKK